MSTDTTTEYLTFSLGSENFALGIETVREVLEMTAITKIPRTPEYMRGVINLRGHAVPVIELRRKFGMSKKEDTVDTCIIIVEIIMDGESSIMGGLVDSVSEVLELADDKIEPAPLMGAAVDTAFIKGIGRLNEEFIIILKLNRIFSKEELAMAKDKNLDKDKLPAEAETEAETEAEMAQA